MRMIFPWVVTNALKELRKEGNVVRLDKSDIPELNNLKASSLTFYVNTNATSTDHELSIVKKHAVSIAKLVGGYSDPDTIRAKGNQLESLVETQLRILQFKIVGKNTNKYNEVKWTKINHDLDLIAEKNNLVIRVEVKNILGVIPPDGIDRKIDVCKHLGIIPVFTVRWIKPYVNCIRRQGGFSVSFKTQIYPFGYEMRVKKLYQRMSVRNKTNRKGHRLDFPVTVRNTLPEKPVAIFERWIKRVENMPTCVDTTVRCKHKS